MIDEKTLQSIRSDFPALRGQRLDNPPVYFDNACTTLVPDRVIAAITEYYSRFPACGGGRSRYWFAEEVTCRIEGSAERGITGSRPAIKDFIHASSENEIIFTLNTSHSINMVALGFKFKPGDVVLISDKEHNSNLVPWLRLQKLGLIGVDNIESAPDGTLDPDAFAEKFRRGNIRLVSLAYTSNLTGYTLPAAEIIRLAHQNGARVLLDAAQCVPHRSIDVQALDVDFLAFSLHKMCGPRGVGVLYAKKELLGHEPHEEQGGPDVIEPVFLGGGTIQDSTYSSYSLLGPPERFEVGIQDYPGQIAAGTAIEYLRRIGMERIEEHEIKLNRFLSETLLQRYGDCGWFRILGPADASLRGGILTFEVKRPNAVNITEDLDRKSNVMIRDGAFCVHSYFNKLYGQGWARPRLPSEHRMTYRLSLYFYNTLDECRVFLETLDQIFRERSYI